MLYHVQKIKVLWQIFRICDISPNNCAFRVAFLSIGNNRTLGPIFELKIKSLQEFKLWTCLLNIASIGSTRIRSRPVILNCKNVVYTSHPFLIPFQCCKNILSNIHWPDLKPSTLNKLDTEELDIAQHKLGQYSKELDRMMNASFINKVRLLHHNSNCSSNQPLYRLQVQKTS